MFFFVYFCNHWIGLLTLNIIPQIVVFVPFSREYLKYPVLLHNCMCFFYWPKLWNDLFCQLIRCEDAKVQWELAHCDFIAVILALLLIIPPFPVTDIFQRFFFSDLKYSQDLASLTNDLSLTFMDDGVMFYEFK